MKAHVHHYSKVHIIRIYLLLCLTAMTLPLIFFASAELLNISYDDSTLGLVWVINLFIVLFTVYEGSRLIKALKHRRIEITEERLLKVEGDTHEIVFFDEIATLKVFSSVRGRIKRIDLYTACQCIPLHKYQDMDAVFSDMQHKLAPHSRIEKKLATNGWASTTIMVALSIVSILMLV